MDPELVDQESGFTLSWGSPLLHFSANVFPEYVKFPKMLEVLWHQYENKFLICFLFFR